MPTDEEHDRARRPAERGHGRRRRRLVGPAPAPRQGRLDPARPRRHADGHRRHARPRPACALAEALADRHDGFIQITNGSPNGEDGHWLIEELADPVRPSRALERRPGLRQQPGAAPRTARLAAVAAATAGSRVYAQGVTTDAGFTLHLRGLEPLRRVRRLVRGDHRHPRRAPGQARRPRPPPGPAGGQGLHRRSARSRTWWCSGPRPPSTKRWANMTLGDVAEETGKHPVDAHARHRGGRRPAHDVLVGVGDQQQLRLLAGDHLLPVRPARHLRRRRPHASS